MVFTELGIDFALLEFLTMIIAWIFSTGDHILVSDNSRSLICGLLLYILLELRPMYNEGFLVSTKSHGLEVRVER